MAKRSRKERKAVPNKPPMAGVKTGVDIIIPVHGRFDLLDKCLHAIPLAAGDVKYNIVIYDNGSPKEEADAFYSSYFLPNLRVIRGKENVGFPMACNIGARRMASSLILFLNSDVILFENAIANMVKDFDDQNVGIVGAKLLFPDGTSSGPANMVQHVGLYTDVRGDFYHLFIGWHPNHPKVQAVKEVLAVTGAALMARRSLWNVAGGFDEIYGRGTFEDIDLCMKVGSMGKSVIVEQSSVGWHYTGATAIAYKIGYNLPQNRAIFKARWEGHYPWSQVIHA